MAAYLKRPRFAVAMAWALVTFGLLQAVTPGSACASSSQAESLAQAAQEAFDSGELDRARELCQAALEMDSRNEDAVRLLTQIDQLAVLHAEAEDAERADDEREAIRIYKRILKLHPDNVNASARLRALRRELRQARWSYGSDIQRGFAVGIHYIPTTTYLNKTFRKHLWDVGQGPFAGFSVDLHWVFVPISWEVGFHAYFFSSELYVHDGVHTLVGPCVPISKPFALYLMGGVAATRIALEAYPLADMDKNTHLSNNAVLLAFGTVIRTNEMAAVDLRVEITPYAERSAYLRLSIGGRFM